MLSENSSMPKVLLCILDGWGIAAPSSYNAVSLAHTPHYDALLQHSPHCLLEASGEAVGLPTGQMGNSEVGHMNIGAGRIVEQIIRRIDRTLLQESPEDVPLWQQTLDRLQHSGGRLHLLGLISEGRVHGCHQQLIALAHSAVSRGIAVCIHGISDGRDSSPQGLLDYLTEVEQAVPKARISTLIGRYYALDRDRRWERTEKAWRLLQCGEGIEVTDWRAQVQEYYDQGITDEFLPALRLNPNYSGMTEKDVLMCCNYRTDRIRQIVQSLAAEDFSGFFREADEQTPGILSMVHYGTDLTTALFQRQDIQGTLGEAVAEAGLSQMRIAETEKFPHVTYFFNGGREEPHSGEEHCLIPSPKVASYDLAPEMSADGITSALLAAMQEEYRLIIVNYANPDMVGHTGDLAATIRGVEAVDAALGQIIPAARSCGYSLLVTADHGNAEQMWNQETGMPHTAHTTNPVRFIAHDERISALNDGVLGDIAPTILHMLGYAPAPAMTGKSLWV